MSKAGAQTGARLAGLAKACVVAALGLAISACVGSPVASVSKAERAQIAASMTRDINVLASDTYGGRKPGTDGQVLTVNYIIDRFQNVGLESGTNDPGNPWRAPVRLISTQPSESSVTLSFGARDVELPAEVAAAYTTRQLALVEGADVVFVGREATRVPTERVAGKVVLMLDEDGVSDARREILFAKGPVAIITVMQDTKSIADQRFVSERERFILASREGQELRAFITNSVMLSVLGEDRWDELLQASDEDDLEAIDLTMAATIEAKSKRREFNSFNVIGRLAGTQPAEGAVLLLAHWDHLGTCGTEADQDKICNGAIDNASGIALIIELARRLKEAGPHDRDIYVMATTAEEAGLLGIRAFTEQPSIPLDSIVAAFNFDSVALAPQGSPVGFIGEGRTVLDEVVMDVLNDAGRKLGSRETAESFIQRQDAWVLLQENVPALVLSTTFGSEITLGPYLEADYHRVSDDIDKIELGGAIDDLLLHEELVKRLADTEVYPTP